MEEATGRRPGPSTAARVQPARNEFERNGTRRLEADLIVVDEMSMVDLPLFGQAAQAVPRGCRLILVGDVDQLPAVGPGACCAT